MFSRIGALLALLLPSLAVVCGAQDRTTALESLRGLAGDKPAVSVPAVQAAPKAVLQAEPCDYSSASGPKLLALMHDCSGRGYRQHEYREASQYMFSAADNVERGGKRGVVDAYSGVFVAGTSSDGSDYRENGDQNGDAFVDSQGMNVEHVWPQSFFSKRLPMKSDLHHLMATFIHPNGMRGSMPFGTVRGQGEYHNDGGAKAGQGVFEPPDAVKGRVARALLYFYTRYYDKNISNGGFSSAFWNDKLELFLSWNRSFPPGADEKRRNGLVEQFKGNRNPFVDDPSLADRVGAAAFQRFSRWDSTARP